MPSSAYVWFDLGAKKSIGTIRWMFKYTGFADAWRLQVSNDRSTWTTLAIRGNATANTWQTFTTSTSARYVRFYFTNPNKDVRLGYLAEVEIYASTSTTAALEVQADEPTPSATPRVTPTRTPIPLTATPTLVPPTPTSTPESTNTPTPTEERVQAAATGSGVVSGTGGAGARCRNGASAEATIITVLPEGARVDLTGDPVGEWQPVTCEGQAGYVHRQYLATGGAASGEPVASDPSTTEAVPPIAPEPTAATPTPYPIVDSGRSDNSTTSLTVYDRDPSTYWASATDVPPAEASVYVDLGAVQPIGTIRWLFAARGLADRMRVQVSEDGTNWATLAEPSNAEVGFWQELPAGVAGRFVRFSFANPNLDPTVGGLAEIEVWPTSGPVVPLTIDPPAPVPTPTPEAAALDASGSVAVAAPAGASYPVLDSGRSENSTTSLTIYDGDPSTYWATDTDMPPAEASVYVDLGAIQPIGRIRWLFAAEGLAEGLQIEVSTDGASWAPLAAPGNAPAGFWQELAAGVSARYVRFAFTNPSQLPAVGGLAEVEVLP